MIKSRSEFCINRRPAQTRYDPIVLYMFLILAFLFAWYRKRKASPANPLQVFGRTPLFFYVIHVHLLAAASWLLNMHQTGGLGETYATAVGALLVLYPLCRWYDRLKQSYPKSLLRYL